MRVSTTRYKSRSKVAKVFSTRGHRYYEAEMAGYWGFGITPQEARLDVKSQYRLHKAVVR